MGIVAVLISRELYKDAFFLALIAMLYLAIIITPKQPEKKLEERRNKKYLNRFEYKIKLKRLAEDMSKDLHGIGILDYGEVKETSAARNVSNVRKQDLTRAVFLKFSV